MLPTFAIQDHGDEQGDVFENCRVLYNTKGSDSSWPRDEVTGAKKGHGQSEGISQPSTGPATAETHRGGSRTRYPSLTCARVSPAPRALPLQLCSQKMEGSRHSFTGSIGALSLQGSLPCSSAPLSEHSGWGNRVDFSVRN